MEEGNILYCPVKDKKFYARFSRAAYYQIANHIEYDNDKEDYFISLNESEVRLFRPGAEGKTT
jgi:hypothetical protein